VCFGIYYRVSYHIYHLVVGSMNIKTENIFPPIPIRSFDWQAVDYDTYDGPGCPIGHGSTEQEAIVDLLEQLEPVMTNRWRDLKTPAPGFTFQPWMRTVDDLQDQIAELVAAVKEADRQLGYIDERWPTGSTPVVRTRINAILAKVEQDQ
jgi:hypothetical protein